VKFSVRPSILLNSRECSPPGVNGGTKFTPGRQVHPWGPGVKLRTVLWISKTYVRSDSSSLYIHKKKTKLFAEKSVWQKNWSRYFAPTSKTSLFGSRSASVSLPRGRLTLIRVARFFLVHDTKTGKNLPNEHKTYQMDIKYPKCP
jgi:hypothetical protein